MSVKRIVVLAILALSGILAGCVGEPRKTLPAKPRFLSASDEEIIRILKSNQAGLKNIKTKVRVRLKVPGAKTAQDLDGLIAFEKPDHIRITCHDILEKRMDFVSDGKRFWLLVNAPGKKEIYKGSSEASRQEGFPFSAELLSEALGIGPINWPEESHYLIEKYPDAYAVLFLLKEKDRIRPLKRVWLDRRNLRISRLQVFTPSGEVFAEASLSDYQKVEDFEIPHSVRIEWPFEESFLELKTKDPSINSALPEKIWKFKVPAGFPVIDIEEEEEALPGSLGSPTLNETQVAPRPPN